MKYQITAHRLWHVAKQGLSLYCLQNCSLEGTVTNAKDSSSWGGTIQWPVPFNKGDHLDHFVHGLICSTELLTNKVFFVCTLHMRLVPIFLGIFQLCIFTHTPHPHTPPHAHIHTCRHTHTCTCTHSCTLTMFLQLLDPPLHWLLRQKLQPHAREQK